VSADPVSRLIEDVYRRRDLAALDELVEPAARPDCLAVLGLLAAFPDARLTVADRIAAPAGGGELVAVRLLLTGTQLAPLPGSAAIGAATTLGLVAIYQVGSRISRAEQRWNAPAAAPVEPVLDLDEIQGNIFPGFNKDHVSLLTFSLDYPRAAARTLAWFADEVASAAEVRAFNRLFSATRNRREHEGSVSATWCNVAVSARLLGALAGDVSRFGDRAFLDGFRARQPAVPPGPDDPDLLVTLAADTEDQLEAAVARVRAAVGGFRAISEQRGATLTGPLAGHEHFGFADGISQPALRGRSPFAPFECLTPRWPGAAANEALPGQDLVWPGEFVFGYPRQDPTDPAVPGSIAEDCPAWARNGSFLVYARYRQDPALFDDFVERTTAELASVDPALARLTPDRLRAALAGRWPSGAPVSRAARDDDPALAADPSANNDFDYLTGTGSSDPGNYPAAAPDPDGRRCPFGAHIRRSNPRDDLGDRAAVQQHRMLRRGVPFGRAGSTEEKGLLFVSYQTSIERQFEFVVRDWLANASLRAPDEGVDPIVRPDGGDAVFGLRLPFGSGRTHRVPLGPPWTRLTEGAYLFTPSISALRSLGTLA